MQDELQQQLRYFGLNAELEARLEPISSSLLHHLESALQHFATQIDTVPGAIRFLYGRDRVDVDRSGPWTHWQALVSGRVDADFAEAAKRTGQRLARLGLDPQWHACAQARIGQGLIRGVIEDGMAAALRPRRGPLGLVGAPDIGAARTMSETVASGLEALVSAIIFDLDLTYAGYAEKLKHDGAASLAGQQDRLEQAIKSAAAMLDSAANGQCTESQFDEIDPAMAPLLAGAERLADRVAGLIQDLDTAGQAGEELAREVLAGAAILVEDRTDPSVAADRLASVSDEASASLDVLIADHAAQLRRLKSMSRRTGRAADDLNAHRANLATVMAQAQARRQSAERVDALGLAANLLAGRMASAGGVEPEGQTLEGDMRALASGLSQLAVQMHLEDERLTQSLREAGQALDSLIGAHKEVAEEMRLALKVTRADGLRGKVLVDNLAEIGEASVQLGEQIAQKKQAESRGLEQIRTALEGAGALRDLAALFAAPDQDVGADKMPTCLAPDETALAAHWHAV